MKNALKIGVSFGLTSGIITTLGLMVGLDVGTHSELAVIGGILTIAIADAFSDSLSLHISEESYEGNSAKDVWESTISTFLVKFFITLTFAIPVLLLSLQEAVEVSVVWGLILLGILSFMIARARKEKIWKFILKNLAIAFVVIVITYFAGIWISRTFMMDRLV